MGSEVQTKSSPTVTPAISHAPVNLLQRKCDCGGDGGISGECEDCKRKRLGVLQRSPINRAQITNVPDVVEEVLRSSGQPLDNETRTLMEPRLGHDFSHVRVHTDAKAVESAQAVNALAYTVGNNVIFGDGHYSPQSQEGLGLLAHELTHVIQQGRTSNIFETISIGAVDDAFERQANQVEKSISSGFRVETNSHPNVSQHASVSQLQRRVNPNFVSCNPPSAAIAATTGTDPVGVITAANTRAIEMLNNAIDELQHTRDQIVAGEPVAWPVVSDATASALQNRFHIDANDRNVWTGRGEGTVDVIIRRLRGARQILDDGAMRYQCLGGANINFTFGGVQCVGPGCGADTRAVSCAGASRLVLCTPFWSDPADDQASTLMHECFHIYFDFIGDTGNLANAHCYEQFVSDLNNVPVPAIFVGACP
jgi:hypothetical protein